MQPGYSNNAAVPVDSYGYPQKPTGYMPPSASAVPPGYPQEQAYVPPYQGHPHAHTAPVVVHVAPHKGGQSVPAGGYASFAQKQVRQGFIRKVYGACLLDAVCTAARVVGVGRVRPLWPLPPPLRYNRSHSVPIPCAPAGILSVQLLITFGITALFIFTPAIQNYVQTHPWTYILALYVWAVWAAPRSWRLCVAV